MSSENNRFLLRLWIPVIAITAVVGTLFIAALTSGDLGRSLPAAIGITLAAVIITVTRWMQKRRIGRMFHAADPIPFLRSFEKQVGRIPHGAYFAAANSATILALYGRFAEAERALDSVAWDDVPPLIQAQGTVARAAIAYARGELTEGLDHAVTATQQGSVDPRAPGAKSSELGFRTWRNLGLALTGRATSTTEEELRTALARMTIVGQIIAAWGLARIAKHNGAAEDLQAMRSFLEKRAPHLAPVLASVNG